MKHFLKGVGLMALSAFLSTAGQAVGSEHPGKLKEIVGGAGGAALGAAISYLTRAPKDARRLS